MSEGFSSIQTTLLTIHIQKADISDKDGKITIKSGSVSVEFDKATAKMKVLSGDKVRDGRKEDIVHLEFGNSADS
mgnify:CR=1 FL=1